MSSLFSMRGRLTRGDFFLTSFSLSLLAQILTVLGATAGISGLLFSLVARICAVVIIAFQVVKRFHDLDRPGTHFWLLLIPFYNIYITCLLLFKKGSSGSNQYGVDPLDALQHGPAARIPSHFHENTAWRLMASGIWITLLLVVLIVLFVVGIAKSEHFFDTENVRIIGRQLLIIGLMVPTMVVIISAGGLDLSIGSVAALVGVIVATAMQRGLDFADAVALGMGAALIVGLVNGALVGMAKISGVLVTLAMMPFLRGIAMTVADHQVIMVDQAESFFGATVEKGGFYLPLCLLRVCFSFNLHYLAAKRIRECPTQRNPGSRGPVLWRHPTSFPA